MTSHPNLVFPDDLQQAMILKGIPLSFSTIQPGDTNPHMKGRGGAEGSVGMLVDIERNSTILSVAPGDSGSSSLGSLGLPPIEENCAASIDRRETSNEWHVQDYLPLGIFILPPIFVRQVQRFEGIDDPVSGEVQLQLEHAIGLFPDKRIFSANQRTFLELDRPSVQWKAVAYEDIIPARPAEQLEEFTSES
jgi:hypothetical protein